MKIVIDYFDDSELAEDVPSEIERVAGMIAEGYTSGELTAGEGCGWWSIQEE